MAAHLWRYWRDDKGLEEALIGYYPKTLAADPQLQAALVQLRNAKLVIDSIMRQYADGEREAPPGTEVAEGMDDE